MQLRIYLWDDRLLFVGPALDTQLHRHHVAQIGVGLQGPVRLRTRENGAWQEGPAFFVPPDTAHAFHSGQGSSLILYLEPESRSYSAFLEHQGLQGLGSVPLPLHEALRALTRAADEGRECEDVDQACRELWRQAEPACGRALDPRIGRALQLVRAQLQGRISMVDIAQRCGMSESHLMHRFTEEMGLPFRRYVVWSRLRAAMEQALQGASLTEAAHVAGFADSAHLSRSFKETFGVTPSFLFAQRRLLDIRICQAF